MSRTIPPLDLMFLLTETPNSPKHVGAALVFDLPPGSGTQTVSKIVRQYRAATPLAPFNYVPEMLGRNGPHWRVAREVDLDYHVQHHIMPTGASYEQFLRLVQDLHESVLDRNRPLFRVWVVEGLPGRRFAMYLKIHHAIVDGMSAMMRITASLNTGNGGRLPPPFFAVEVSRHAPRAPESVLRRLTTLNQTALRQTIAVKDFSLGVIRKGIGRLFARSDEGSLPFTAPHSPLNTPTRTPRSFATLSLPLAEMKAVGSVYGGTLNDVAAAVVDAGIHAYLRHIGHPVKKRLVALCPVSLRDSDDKTATTKASMIFAPLGAPAATIEVRIEQIIGAMRSGKDEMRAMSKDAAMIYGLTAFGLGEATDASRIGRVTGHLANFVLSNVPGSRESLSIEGAALVGMYPVSALGAGIGLNVTLASHAGSMDFGFVGNGLALPELPLLAQFTRQAFDALAKAAARRAAGAKSATTPGRATKAPSTAKATARPRLRRSAAR